jgi:plasmid stabilization system protein ParE
VKRVRWHAIARRELRSAAEYYEAQRPALDLRFIDAVERTVALLARFPGVGAPVHGDYRRMVVHRFPYSIVYREHDRFIRIVALTHHKLDPVGWVGR